MGAFMKSIDTIVWGRKTYTKGIEMGMKDGGFGPKIKNYLFSRQPQRSLLSGFELVKELIKPFAQRLRAQPGKNIWMMGGGEIITSFLEKGEIDEFSIHVIRLCGWPPCGNPHPCSEESTRFGFRLAPRGLAYPRAARCWPARTKRSASPRRRPKHEPPNRG